MNTPKPAESLSRIQLIDVSVKVFDVLFKAMIAIITVWWAIKSFAVQQDSTDRNIRAQLETQREASRSQREMQEATLMAAIIERVKCQGSQEQQLQQLIAMKLIRTAAPTFSDSLSDVLVGCAKTPIERQIIENFRGQTPMRELKTRFSELLGNARQSRRLGLTDEATLEEFETALSRLPKQYNDYFDAQELSQARTARREEKYAEAGDHYERAFRRIETNEGINALPPRLLEKK